MSGLRNKHACPGLSWHTGNLQWGIWLLWMYSWAPGCSMGQSHWDGYCCSSRSKSSCYCCCCSFQGAKPSPFMLMLQAVSGRNWLEFLGARPAWLLGRLEQRGGWVCDVFVTPA